jgi:hypothetical protein
MPVVYEIDQSRNTIHTTCVGDTTLYEVVEHFHTLEQDPDCPSHLDVLLNLSEQENVPSSSQLRIVSEEITRVKGRVQFGACAIVVGNDALFGAAMVFEVLAARGFRVTKIFRERDAALSWLERVQQRPN